jgi:hypothetical protein
MTEKVKSLIFCSIMFLFLLFLLAGCNRTNPTGGPFDAVATQGVQLRAEIYLYDTQPDGTTKTAANVTIQLVSPQSVTETGTTDANGYVRLVLFGYGNHRIIIPKDTAHGYTTPLEYSLDAESDDTVKTIIRSAQVISMSLDPLYVNAFGSASTIIKYDVSYKADISKMYTLSVNGLPNGATWQFTPPYVQNNGDTSVLTITTPKYLRIGKYYTYMTFTAAGDDGDGTGATYPVGDTVNGYALYQNWAFDLAGVSVTNTATVTFASNQLGRAFQLVNLTNFPTQYPLQVNVIDLNVQMMKNGIVSYFPAACSSGSVSFNVASNPAVSVAYPPASPVVIPNIYNNMSVNSTKIYIQMPCSITGYTWIHMPLEFTNSDGFDYIVNCGTNY